MTTTESRGKVWNEIRTVIAVGLTAVCAATCHAQYFMPAERRPKQNAARVAEIEAHLPEQPGTPAPRPSNRTAWDALAREEGADAIIAAAEEKCGEPIPELTDELYFEYSRTGKSPYGKPYFQRRHALDTFMLAEALEWKGRFLPEIRRYLEAILAEKSWTLPEHDGWVGGKLVSFEGTQPLVKLFSSQRAWTVAYAVDWFGDLLPAELVSRARAECRRRILDPYLEACRDTSKAKQPGCHWFFGGWNWNPVCHAGCVATALILLENRHERAECVEAAERALPVYIEHGFAADGYCSEGMAYWNYGFGHYVALVSIVKQATGGFVDLGASGAKVARIAAYGCDFQLEDGLSPYFSDGQGNPERSLLELAHRFWPDAIPAFYAKWPILKGTIANYGPIPACRTVAMRAFGPKGVAVADANGQLPLRTVFESGQVYIFRPGQGKKGLALALKGGHNQELHNHNDIGSYAISLGGAMLSGDVGPEAYTARTFSNNRYEGEVLSSLGHPVPRVGGGLQRPGRKYAAKVLAKSFGEDEDKIVLDLKGAYECPSLKRLERTFSYKRAKGVVTVRDEVEFSEPTAFDDPIMTLASVERQGNGWVLSSNGEKIAVKATATGGAWSWNERTLENGRPDTTPRRIAVVFEKPVSKAAVEFSFSPAGDIVLAERGASAEYTIVLPSKASPSQKYAAEELRDFTERMTGVKLPIATDAAPLPEKAILLGETKYTERLAGRIAPGAPKRGADGFRLVARPPHLLVVGSPERGTLYGVYEILERFGGCRWYSSLCEKVPRLDRFAVPADLDDTQVPAFEMREPFFWDVESNGAFAARLRANQRQWWSRDEKYGGNPFRFGGGLINCHTFDVLVPPDKYFDSHPEYFSFVDGRRLKRPSQLCLTNPDVLRIVTSNVLARIRSDPRAKFYGVSQNDNPNYCRCPKCAAVDEEEGSHAGTVVRFVNAVAEAVEKEFPNAIIETLAYQYSRKPPKKTRLRRNVMPCLCSIECDFAQPLDVSQCKENVRFCDEIRGWASQASKLYVWDYVVNCRNYMIPFPNVYALQDNVKFFRDNGVKFLFAEGTYHGVHGDFTELKAWLLAKWMWNPDLPIKALLDDFFSGYYGKAAPFARRYFEAINRLQLLCSTSPARPLHCNPWDATAVPDSVFEWASDCWKMAADAVTDDPVSSYNVRMSAFSADFMNLERIRRKHDKLLCLATKAPDAGWMDEAKPLAKSLLDRLDEAKENIHLETPDRHQFPEQWRQLLKRKTGPLTPSSCGEIEDLYVFAPDGGAKHMDDPKSDDGRALKIDSSLVAAWTASFAMNRVVFEPGAKYRLRVRARVEKLRDGGEAFWAGVYDPVANRCRGKGAQPRTEDTSEEYAWYDVCEWIPQEDDYFWIGSGRCGKDGKPAIKAVWVDKIDFVRVDNHSN